MHMKKLAAIVVALALAGSAFADGAPDSKRLALAKDYIADEQWTRAIAELRVVANDARDPNRDEALFWLAHSEHQAGDQQGAIEAIGRLERLFPRSRWVRPARSLRIEIAQRLQRDDVLWVIAQPTPRPKAAPRGFSASVPTPEPPSAVTPAPPDPPQAPAALPKGHLRMVPETVRRPTESTPVVLAPPAATPRPGPQRPMVISGLMPEGVYSFDTDLKIEALAGLMDSHSDRVIPLLREIALDDKNPSDARRAVFALARSNRTDARNTVVEVARRGPNPVRIAAIREIGRFPEGTFSSALVSIAKGESDPAVRDTAIVTLGRTGARLQLRSLYAQMPTASRYAVLTALFNAKDDDELIRIATSERDQRLRTRARQQLRLLGTPKAIKFLTDNP
jgi:hypothetical protein